jgi:hypothetical protein
MTVGRRQVMLGTLDLGVTLVSGPRTARARKHLRHRAGGRH